MQTKLIRVGYNITHRAYLSERAKLKTTSQVKNLLQLLRPQSQVLDLGCGSGEPIDSVLLKNGHSVIGVDLSEEMIATARRANPGGSYFVRDIASLTPREYAVDAIVCLYTLFHLPRATHGTLIRTMATFIPVGGLLLITMGDKLFEGFTDFYGVQMWWSQWGPVKNRELLHTAGFTILIDEIEHSAGENHQVILARKN